MLEQALRTYLLSKTAIAALIGARAHVGDFVPGKDDMPALGIESLESASQQCLDGTPCDLQFPLFRIVAKGQLYTDSDKLIRLVRAAFLAVPLGMTVNTTVDGAPITVTIEQVDLLGEPSNDPEEDYGHGFTIKPRVLKIRVGWREPITSI
jgi:hypothetical protein